MFLNISVVTQLSAAGRANHRGMAENDRLRREAEFDDFFEAPAGATGRTRRARDGAALQCDHVCTAIRMVLAEDLGSAHGEASVCRYCLR